MGKVLNKKNKNEQTPLFLAIHQGFAELVGKIIHSIELNAMVEDKEKRTPLYIAIDFNQLESFKKILETVPRGLGTPRNRRRLLCHAAEESQGIEVFEWLLTHTIGNADEETEIIDENKKKFDLKLKNKGKTQKTKEELTFEKLLESQENNPMHCIALSKSHFSCKKYDMLVNHLSEEKDTLVEAYLNHQNKEKQTPLHVAAQPSNIHTPIGDIGSTLQFKVPSRQISAEQTEITNTKKKKIDLKLEMKNKAQATKEELTKLYKTDKLDLIAKMLKSGADPKLLNENDENFLSMLKNLPEEWFEILMKNEETELRRVLFEEGDDTSLMFLFEKFQSLNQSQEDDTHLINLVKEIFENPRNQKFLLCHAAEKGSDVEGFKWLLTQAKNYFSSMETANVNNDQFTFINMFESQSDSPLHSIAQCKSNYSCESYDLLVDHLKEESLVKSFLNHQNKEKQTPLHIASEHSNIHNLVGNNVSTEQLKKDKLALIAKMLKSGADPNLLNKNGDNFFNIIKRFPDEWFEFLMGKKETELRKILIDKGGDSSLTFIIEKFQSLNEKREDDDKVHPINLIKEVFEKRELFKKAFLKLLLWEGEYHKNQTGALRECCYKKVTQRKAFIIHHEIEQVITKELKFGYYVKQVFNGMFLIFFVMKSLDFVMDITMNVKFYEPMGNDIYQNLPDKSTCNFIKENQNKTAEMEYTLPCYFYEMNKLMLFASGIAIFLLNYISDSFFVMNDESTNHYKAWMAGYCCWEKVPKNKKRTFLLQFYWFFVLPIINQITIYVYGFYVRSFGAYWRKKLIKMQKVQNKKTDVTEPDGASKKCKNDKCFKNITEEDIKIFDKLQDNCDKTVTVGKIITSSTENAFMPLLQLSILFPNFISLFPTKDSQNLVVNKEWIKKIVGGNFPFIAILLSIVTSLTSMGIALTETYFSKSGRKEYKTIQRWALYFSSIIFQVVPKIFAYQMFAFGFVPYIAPKGMGPDLIIPVLLTLPLILSLIRAIVFYFAFARDDTEKTVGKKIKDSLLFGLATMYVCMENDFQYRHNTLKSLGAEYSRNETENQSPDESPTDDENQNLDGFSDNEECHLLMSHDENEGKIWKGFEKCHLFHDISSFLITFTMTVLGAIFIKANVDKALFIVVINEMQLFGLLLKSTYYLHVHPWEKLNPNYKTYVKIHQVMTGLFIIGIVATVIYYAVTSTIKIFTITVIFLFIPIGLVSNGNTYNTFMILLISSQG